MRRGREREKEKKKHNASSCRSEPTARRDQHTEKKHTRDKKKKTKGKKSKKNRRGAAPSLRFCFCFCFKFLPFFAPVSLYLFLTFVVVDLFFFVSGREGKGRQKKKKNKTEERAHTHTHMIQWLCGGCSATATAPDGPMLRCPVVLNVYDLSPCINFVLDRVGFGGVYHSGVEIGDVEYAYGGDSVRGTGVWRQYPRSPPKGYACLKQSLHVGYAMLPLHRFDAMLRRLERDFQAAEYDAINHNCNHFSRVFCQRLLGADLPDWVNAAAENFAKVQAACTGGCAASFVKRIVPASPSPSLSAAIPSDEDSTPGYRSRARPPPPSPMSLSPL
eukprot:TRINITY_DN3954_c0_g1_i4.p1 TRINITY_DN3954_c0_g1~~TRINITY_DN3954_c0_g1_i4.p1  ORF type:complete len:341 (+),score=69.26 TRINITY_DN3954_c0_g1_i4:33-1025(+)